MVLIKRIRKRGANIVVEANAEVLFAPGGEVGRWTNRFSQRARAFAAAEAPSNKRPRWGHYGKPLKSTITASTTYQPGRMKVHSAVGSTSAHGLYVDQGTGIYAGRGAYPAKVLPPWTRGSPSLYESTWHPPGQNPDHQVMIKGQKGQFFLDKGLKRAFQSMRMRAFQVPGSAQISGAMSSFPESLANFSGATPANSAFRASLAEWREWRDEAFNAGRVLGVRPTTAGNRRRRARAEQAARDRQARQARNRTARAAASAERSRKYRQQKRDNIKAKSARPTVSRTSERARFLAAVIKKYGASNVEMQSLTFEGGYYYITVKESTVRASDGATRPAFKEVRGRKVG